MAVKQSDPILCFAVFPAVGVISSFFQLLSSIFVDINEIGRR